MPPTLTPLKSLWIKAINEYAAETELTQAKQESLLTRTTPEDFLKTIKKGWKDNISDKRWANTQRVLSEFWGLLDVVSSLLGLAATVRFPTTSPN